MLTVETKQKLGGLAMFALPVGVIIGTGAYFGGPAPATANVAPLVAAAGGANGSGLQTAKNEHGPVVEHIAWLTTQEFGSSPLYYAAENEVMVVDDTPIDDSIPQFTIKMIMASSKGNTALIDGQTYQVGDMLINTKWTITEINSRNRSVTIEDTLTSRVHTETVQ